MSELDLEAIKAELAAMEAERDTFRTVAQDNKRHVEILTATYNELEVEIDKLKENLIRCMRSELALMGDRDEWERKATDSAELAKATREKLREAHNELHEVIGYLHKREQRLEDARSRLALYEVWDDSVPPGGFVCAACGVPVESEPCAEHWKGAPA